MSLIVQLLQHVRRTITYLTLTPEPLSLILAVTLHAKQTIESRVIIDKATFSRRLKARWRCCHVRGVSLSIADQTPTSFGSATTSSTLLLAHESTWPRCKSGAGGAGFTFSMGSLIKRVVSRRATWNYSQHMTSITFRLWCIKHAQASVKISV